MGIIALVLALAGAPANTAFQCAPISGHAGWTEWDTTPIVVTLTPEMCSDLNDVHAGELTSDPSTDANMAQGLLIALHEASHAAGWRDETDTECRALTLVGLAVWGLGLSPQVIADAWTWDRTWGSQYHQRPCQAADSGRLGAS